MKKTRKVLILSLGLSGGLFIVVFLLLYVWFSVCWKLYYTETEMQTMAEKINSAHKLPANYYAAYGQIYPGRTDKTLAKMSWEVLLYFATNSHGYEETGRCSCINAAATFENKMPINYHSMAYYAVAHGLESYTTEQACFDYYQSLDNIEKYATLYFKQPLGKLSIEECKELIVRLKSPSIYEKRPDLLEKKLKELATSKQGF